MSGEGTRGIAGGGGGGGIKSRFATIAGDFLFFSGGEGEGGGGEGGRGRGGEGGGEQQCSGESTKMNSLARYE